MESVGTEDLSVGSVGGEVGEAMDGSMSTE